MKIKKEEVKAMILSSFILGLVFGFDDGNATFELSKWLRNYMTQVIFSLIFIVIMVLITKFYANKRGIDVSFSIWKNKIKKTTIASGIIFPLLISAASYGKIFFAAVLAPVYSYKKTKRFGEKFEMPSEKELAKISSISPLCLTVIGVLITTINGLEPLATIPLSIALSLMIPLPKLNGIYVYFGSRALYIFSISFVLISFFLVRALTGIETLMYALLLAVAIMVAYYTKEFLLV